LGCCQGTSSRTSSTSSSRSRRGRARTTSASCFVTSPRMGRGRSTVSTQESRTRTAASSRSRQSSIWSWTRSSCSARPPRTTGSWSSPGPPFLVTNMKGIEVEPFAVQLARVTLWMGHKLAVVELGLDEPVLPLPDLSGIRRADALKIAWPTANAIIGNPPYIGTKLMRSRLGDEYLEWLSDQFHIGVKDYCVYWIRKAHEQLKRGDRAGLVGTHSIREGKNRKASLDFVTARGGLITNAASSQEWSGAANVHVSIVNLIKERAARTGALFSMGRKSLRLPRRCTPPISRWGGVLYPPTTAGNSLVLSNQETALFSGRPKPLNCFCSQTLTTARS
jgi:hypothetical protein